MTAMTDTRFQVTQEAISLVRDAVRYGGASASTSPVQEAVDKAENDLDRLSAEVTEDSGDEG